MHLSSIFGNGMVIQRNKPIFINGYSNGNYVTIQFIEKIYRTKVTNGYFELYLDSLPAGGPHEMVLYDGDKTVISDIWIGDVWVLGGQSNMELPVRRTLAYSQEKLLDTHCHKYIHMFQPPQKYNFQDPCSMYDGGGWETIDKNNVMNCSAIGYFFAKDISVSQNVPIGLIHTAIGGTPIESWMNPLTLQQLGAFQTELNNLRSPDYITTVQTNDQSRINNWYNELSLKDKGCTELWYETSWSPDTYKTIQLPKLWLNTELESHHGSVWLQTDFEVSSDWIDKEISLALGAFIERDEVYINGVLVGHTDYRYPPRNYSIPPQVLKEGTNTLTIRLIIPNDYGGAIPGKNYMLHDGNASISLEGLWKYRIGCHLSPLQSQTFFQFGPSGVFNGMINPLKNIGITGVLFYQGESNTGHPYNYQKFFTHMIQDWRQILGQGDIPFLYVQLTNYGDGKAMNPGTHWAVLREHQRLCLKLPNVAMTVSIDAGEYNDLHPQNKVLLGNRLALAARRLVYGEEIISDGPLLESVDLNPESICIYFKYCDGGLVTSTHKPVYMHILWSDNTEDYTPAILKDNSLILIRKDDLIPIRIRYAWDNNPLDAILYNKQDLPASPFEIYWNNESKNYIF